MYSGNELTKNRHIVPFQMMLDKHGVDTQSSPDLSISRTIKVESDGLSAKSWPADTPMRQSAVFNMRFTAARSSGPTGHSRMSRRTDDARVSWAV